MASEVQLETLAEYPMKYIIDMVAGLPQTYEDRAHMHLPL